DFSAPIFPPTDKAATLPSPETSGRRLCLCRSGHPPNRRRTRSRPARGWKKQRRDGGLKTSSEFPVATVGAFEIRSCANSWPVFDDKRSYSDGESRFDVQFHFRPEGARARAPTNRRYRLLARVFLFLRRRLDYRQRPFTRGRRPDNFHGVFHDPPRV